MMCFDLKTSLDKDYYSLLRGHLHNSEKISKEKLLFLVRCGHVNVP